MLVFYQCSHREWISWGRECAEDFAKDGFAIVRVNITERTTLEVKVHDVLQNQKHESNVNRESDVSSRMRAVAVPLVARVTQKLKEGGKTHSQLDRETLRRASALMLRDVTTSTIAEVTHKMESGELPQDMQEWVRSSTRLDVVLPSKTRACSPRLDVVAVTK
jgi:hypothetical protein